MSALAGTQLALQLLHEETQGMERLTQIMAGHSDKARLGLVGGFELARALFDFAFQIRVGFVKPGGHGV